MNLNEPQRHRDTEEKNTEETLEIKDQGQLKLLFASYFSVFFFSVSL